MAELVGKPLPALEYSRGLGMFRYADTKKIVGRSLVLNTLDQHIQQSSVRLQGITRLMIAGKIELSEWQTRMAESLKTLHLQAGAFGAGGKQQLTQRHYGFVGRQLKTEYDAIDGFARDLAAGKLTEKQALARTAMYGQSIALSFHRAEHVTKMGDGFLGKRSLDAGASHCPSCPAYVTDGFVPADEIIPPGTNCECKRLCKCQVVYRRGAA